MRRWLLALALVGCASEEPKAEPVRTDRPVLTFYTGLSQAEWTVLREAVFPDFEREAGCVVRGVDVPSGETARKLQALKQAGATDVDVIAQDNIALGLLVRNGLMTELDAPAPPETIPALLEVGRFGGKTFFTPFRPNVEITYWNAAYFAKHHLAPPTDWDELLHVAKTFHAREGVGRVAIKADGTAAATVHYVDFINAAGGDPLTLDDAGCRRAFTYLQTLWPYLSPESRRADFNTMNQFLAMESVYLGQNWPFGIEVVVKQGEKADVLAYHGWRGPVREAHTLGGDVLGIPVGAPHPELAKKFIAYLQSRPVQRTLVSKLAWPPMRTDAYADVAGWQQPYFTAVKEALVHAVARPNVPYWEAFDRELNAAAREILVDGRDVGETLGRHAAVVREARARTESGYKGGVSPSP